MTQKTIDLNADMGEGYGYYKIGHDDDLLNIVSSINVACGFHGGDPTIMQNLCSAAQEKGIALGAHPGFQDVLGFGRRQIYMSASDLEYQIAYQIGALIGIAQYSGVKVSHVKPHGALYNMAAADANYARAIVQAIKAIDRKLMLLGLPKCEMEEAAEKADITYIREGFCDRLYLDDGSLLPRSQPGSVIVDPDQAALQALHLIRDHKIITSSGAVIEGHIETLCIHGDNPASIEIAQAVRSKLLSESVNIQSINAVASQNA